MAYNIHIDKLSGQAAFYAVKDKAWHGLGQIVEDAKTPEEAYKLAHLDYIVDCRETYVDVRTKQTNEYGTQLDPIFKTVPGVKATFRTDTGTVFGAVGDRYTVVQNSSFINFIYDIFKRPNMFEVKDIVIETAGALGAGEKVFVTAHIPGFIKLLGSGDDVAQTYILITSTHDGSGLFTAGLTNIRVVCNNTLNAALPGLANKVQFKHTKSIHDNLKQGSALMGLTQKWNAQQMLAYEAMSKVEIQEKDVVKYVSQLILTKEQIAAMQEVSWNMGAISDEQISTKGRNKFYEVIQWIDMGAGQKNEAIRGSVYWMYQGYNGYLNNGVAYKDQEDRFNSLTDGRSMRLNQQAFDLALVYV